LQEHHLPSITNQNIEGCDGINEAKAKEVIKCNTNYGRDNERNQLVEQLPMTKVSVY